jgi:anti-sigma-K factor RskA
MLPLQPYKTYELWLIPADGRDPIPAGTFKPDDHGNASLMLPELPRGVTAKAFGVTIEDDGGAQTPTMPIILAGA